MDVNFVFSVFCLTVITLVAIVFGKSELAEKTIGGLHRVLENALSLLSHGNRESKHKEDTDV
jgi:hypothetical protein